jgi:predicted metalloprotease with PDZ domain
VDTRPLWFVEGFAEHYARLALVRRGVLARQDIYDEIARNVRALAARPQAEIVNRETAGAAAGRQTDREAAEPLALKSPLAALAQDVEMRRSSGGAVGADSLIRFLQSAAAGVAAVPGGQSRAATPGAGAPVLVRPMPYDSIMGWMMKAGGSPVRSLYATGVAGTGRLPYAQILGEAGLELAKRDVEDLGLGAALVPDGEGGFTFRDIVPHGLGGRIGLLEGDHLVSVNGQPVTSDNLLPILAVVADLRSRLRDGEPFRVEVERGGRHVELKGYLEPWTRSVTSVVEDDRASAPQAALRESVFAGSSRQASASSSEPTRGSQ